MLIAALEPSLGTWKASLAAGFVCVVVALLALLPLRESFGKDLDFVEE
jgi:hypothetical protein